jgi:hypothetical protein
MPVKKRYFYQARNDKSRHRGKRSVYLVEHLVNEKCHVKVSHLGYVKGQVTTPELRLLASQNAMSVVGEEEPAGRHVRLQVILGTDYQEVR